MAANDQKRLEAWKNLAGGLSSAVREMSTVALGDAATDLRTEAVRILGALNREAREILPLIRTALKRAALWDDDEEIRALAIETLTQAGEWDRPAIAELVQALNDPEPAARFSAAQALGERGEESQAAVGMLLQKALRDPDGGVRLEAAMALYRIDGHEEKILPLLIKALQDPDEVRRWIAADCLGEIGPRAREAAPALHALLAQHFKSPLIRASVALALEKIEGKRTGETPS
jgi:HEAT repeat protein